MPGDAGVAPMSEIWEQAYQQARHRELWDCPWPSPELVGFVAGSGGINGATVLDLGCGAGSDAVFLAEHARRVIAVDLSRTALLLGQQRAAEANVTVEWCVADVLRLRPELFETVWAGPYPMVGVNGHAEANIGLLRRC